MILIKQFNMTKPLADLINSGTEEGEAFKVLYSDIQLKGAVSAEVVDKFYTEAYKINSNSLDEAFEVTNIPVKQELVTRVGEQQRSSSVGDVFDLEGKQYVCMPFGFELLRGAVND